MVGKPAKFCRYANVYLNLCDYIFHHIFLSSRVEEPTKKTMAKTSKKIRLHNKHACVCSLAIQCILFWVLFSLSMIIYKHYWIWSTGNRESTTKIQSNYQYMYIIQIDYRPFTLHLSFSNICFKHVSATGVNVKKRKSDKLSCK